MGRQVTVYDKGKFHDDSVASERLPRDRADTHLVFFLRWLIEHDLMSEEFNSGSAGRALAKYQRGRRSVFWLFRWWDRVLASDMLSEQGNAFAGAYFSYENGEFLTDYEELLAGSQPSTFHVQYTEANYALLASRIDERWASFRASGLPEAN